MVDKRTEWGRGSSVLEDWPREESLSPTLLALIGGRLVLLQSHTHKNPSVIMQQKSLYHLGRFQQRLEHLSGDLIGSPK